MFDLAVEKLQSAVQDSKKAVVDIKAATPDAIAREYDQQALRLIELLHDLLLMPDAKAKIKLNASIDNLCQESYALAQEYKSHGTKGELTQEEKVLASVMEHWSKRKSHVHLSNTAIASTSAPAEKKSRRTLVDAVETLTPAAASTPQETKVSVSAAPTDNQTNSTSIERPIRGIPTSHTKKAALAGPSAGEAKIAVESDDEGTTSDDESDDEKTSTRERAIAKLKLDTETLREFKKFITKENRKQSKETNKSKESRPLKRKSSAVDASEEKLNIQTLYARFLQYKKETVAINLEELIAAFEQESKSEKSRRPLNTLVKKFKQYKHRFEQHEEGYWGISSPEGTNRPMALYVEALLRAFNNYLKKSCAGKFKSYALKSSMKIAKDSDNEPVACFAIKMEQDPTFRAEDTKDFYDLMCKLEQIMQPAKKPAKHPFLLLKPERKKALDELVVAAHRAAINTDLDKIKETLKKYLNPTCWRGYNGYMGNLFSKTDSKRIDHFKTHYLNPESAKAKAKPPFLVLLEELGISLNAHKVATDKEGEGLLCLCIIKKGVEEEGNSPEDNSIEAAYFLFALAKKLGMKVPQLESEKSTDTDEEKAFSPVVDDAKRSAPAASLSSMTRVMIALAEASPAAVTPAAVTQLTSPAAASALENSAARLTKQAGLFPSSPAITTPPLPADTNDKSRQDPQQNIELR